MSELSALAQHIADEVEQAYIDNEFEREEDIHEFISDKIQEFAATLTEEVEYLCNRIYSYLNEDESQRREDYIEGLVSEGIGEVFENFQKTKIEWDE